MPEELATPTATFAVNISPTLAGMVRPLRDCTRHPENARKHSIPDIMASLQQHGQRSPIVVQASTGYVVKGNGTWEAAWKLGWGELAQDWQELDDKQAYAYLLADNKASDKSGYDNKRLITGLTKMVEGPGLAGSLWTVDELEDLIAAEDAVPTVEAGFTGGFAETAEHAAERAAAGEQTTVGQKRQEISLVLTTGDHALFVSWLASLKKRWNASSTAAIYEAVRRQAELEERGTAAVGDFLQQDTRAEERYAALKEFRDLIMTLGADKEYRGSWLLGQLQMTMSGLKIPITPAPPSAPPLAPVPAGDAPSAEPAAEGEPDPGFVEVPLWAEPVAEV